MKFYNYIIESKPQPISITALKTYLQRLAKERIFTKERYEKYNRDAPTFEKYIQWGLDIDFKIEAAANQVKLSIDKYDLGYLLGINQHKIQYSGHDFTNEMIESMDKLLYKVGWYVERMGKSGGKWDYYIIFEPLYGERVKKIPKYLYHFSGLWNKDKILRRGLTPHKSERESFRYPPRVHLLLKYDKKDIAELRIAMASYGHSAEDYYHGNITIVPVVIFKIDTGRLNKGTKFFIDTGHSKNAVWTYNAIPPNALSVVYQDKEEK